MLWIDVIGLEIARDCHGDPNSFSVFKSTDSLEHAGYVYLSFLHGELRGPQSCALKLKMLRFSPVQHQVLIKVFRSPCGHGALRMRLSQQNLGGEREAC